MDTINQYTIQSLLHPFAPSETAAKAAQWLVDNRGRFSAQALKHTDPDVLKNLGRNWYSVERNSTPDKRATGEALWAGYCHFSGISYLQSSENLDRGMDFLAAKFHYADRASLRQHQAELYAVLVDALSHHPWRC